MIELTPEKPSLTTMWKNTVFNQTIPYERPSLCSSNPSSYDSDSDSNYTPSFATTLRLRTSISTIPEDQLREIMIKLVERNPGFQHALAKELLSPTKSTTPLRRKSRKSRRGSDVVRQRKCVNCGECVKNDKNHGFMRHGECNFHPGHIQDEVYEFLSRTPEGHDFKVLRTIKMWTCCDEDAWSPGCVASGHVLDSDHPLVEDSEFP